jgi:hypothetical protein
MIDITEKLKKRILVLNERVWENRMPQTRIDEWLKNFNGKVSTIENEQLHALFWLSQFMYFGSREIRVLLRALYRDHFLCPLLQEIQNNADGEMTEVDLQIALSSELQKTKFFGVGNPSESGVHLLYYFRQENMLSKSNFMDAIQIFSRDTSTNIRTLRKPQIKRYIFIDDICGSGDTAQDYSREVLTDLLKLNPAAKVAYYCLFASTNGLKQVRDKTLFQENCAAVYELDDSYRCLSQTSRFLTTKEYEGIDMSFATDLVRRYGELICTDLSWCPEHATGWKDSQMLMGFHHNTPDNTLPIVWHDSLNNNTITNAMNWQPAFKRYPKVSGDSL